MTAAAPVRLRHVDRWLARRGKGLWPISWDAARLLDDRVRARRRAETYGWVFTGTAVVAIALSVGTARSRPGSANDAAAGWWAAAVVALAVGSVVRQSVLMRDEEHLANRLPSSMSVVARPGWWRKLGPVRVAALGVAFGSPVAMALLFAMFTGSRILLAVYTATLLVVLACAAFTAHRVVGAATVAVDRTSILIDERLRMRDLDNASLPLVLLVLGAMTPVGLFGGPGSAHSDLFLTVGVATMLIFAVLNSLGRTKAIGPRVSTPR